MKCNLNNLWLSLAAYTLILAPIYAQDAMFYGIAKGENYWQSSAATPTIQTNGYQFLAWANAGAMGMIKAATLTRPNSSTVSLTRDPESADLSATYATAATRDAASAYPDGAYRLSIQTVDDGTPTAYLTLAAGAMAIGTIPQIQNFSAATNVNADSDFVLQWNAWADGTTNDYLQLTIEDAQSNVVFETSDPLVPYGLALNGTNTAVLIPAGTLDPGQNYTAQLTFYRGNYNTTNYAGVTGFSGYFKETDFTLHTVDLSSFGVTKGAIYFQTNSTAPTSPWRYNFNAFLQTSGTNNIYGGTVIIPGGTSLPMSASGYYTNLLASAGLERNFSNGTYQVTLNTVHDGNKTVSLTMSSNAIPVPYLSNFDNTYIQAIPANSGMDTVISWKPWVGGSVTDFVQLTIVDTNFGAYDIAFQTGSPGESDALNGTNYSVVIPSGTFSEASVYQVQLHFARGIGNTAAYPGSLGFAGYNAKTYSCLSTFDIDGYGIYKSQHFIQTNSGTPVSLGYQYESFVDVTEPNLVFNAFSTYSGGPTWGMPATNDYYYESALTNKSIMDGTFGSAKTYKLQMATAYDYPPGTPWINGFLNLPADSYPTVIPQISNFAAAQAINSALDFTLTWNPMNGAATNMVSVDIADDLSGESVFSTADWGEAGRLTGLSNSVVIPADTLVAGHTYTATLNFTRAIVTTNGTYAYDYTQNSLVPGFTGFYYETEFPMKAYGSIYHPEIQSASSANGSNYTFTVWGDSALEYTLEYLASLTNTVWVPLTTQSGQFTYVDRDRPFFKSKYYRVREVYGNQPPPYVSIQGTILGNGSAPVAGAVISTSLDAQTASTDASGTYFLQTLTTPTLPYTVTVTKSGYQVLQTNLSSITPRNLTLTLKP